MMALTYMGEGHFQAPPGFIKRCDAEYVIGETLRWQICHERSAKSHAHYFATVDSAWANLPEALAMDFPSADHLRKHALIKAGFCTMAKMVFGDEAEALRACSILRGMDSYAICEVSGRVVTVYRAQSQSLRAMGAKVFQDSKDKVLAVISQIIGADATQAGQAA